jgi:hypothetical protein
MRTYALVASAVTLPFLLACGSDAADAPTETAGAAFVSPTDTASVGEPIELAVDIRDPAVRRVRFLVDGREIGLCDPSLAEEDCRRGSLFTWTTTFEAGSHDVRAVLEGATAPTTLKRTVVAAANLPDLPSEAEEPLLPVAPEDLGDLGTLAASRGTLDPSRGYHSVFGGRSWAVSNQRVVLKSGSLSGSVSSVSGCMARYGASIRKWADKYKISRASVVATALTESNCTNPSGSSDGLSSGPMQVTGSTCAAVTGVPRATCKARMHSSPDFSFEVGIRYMATSYQRKQHGQDPPKIGAAYNAGSIRSTRSNAWHMVSTGNHIDRFVSHYNAYRTWESSTSARVFEAPPVADFSGTHVSNAAALPRVADEGATVFVGDFAQRDGSFYEYRGGTWVRTDAE